MELSFASFVQQVFSSPAMLVTVLLTLGVIFVNGWTDAPNAIATCIATRCINVRAAILTSAVFNFLGVLIMTHINSSVASTISNMVDFGGNTHEALIALCAALFSIVVKSCDMVKLMLKEFASFRHSKSLRDHIIAINTLEEQADQVFVTSMRELHTTCTDPVEIICWREVYFYLEKCTDACEHVADVVEQIVMKNS